MDYISAREAAEKWGVSLRLVQRLLKDGRIDGARKFDRSWLIPVGAKKPDDPRKKQLKKNNETSYLPYLLLTTEIPIVSGEADRQWDMELITQFEYELEYLRGNFEKAKECFFKTASNARTKLCACTLSLISSISTNDYESYNEIKAFLEQKSENADDIQTKNTIENIFALVHSSLFALNSISGEMKRGDLSSFCDEVRNTGAYISAKCLLASGDYHALAVTAEMALALINHKPDEYTSVDIYLHLMCAAGCVQNDDRDEAKKHIIKVLDISMKQGYYTPIAENISICNGLVEQCMAEKYPQQLKKTVSQWENNSLNWVRFHNSFSQDNITSVLSLREQHLAKLLVNGKTYDEVAEIMGLSRGRVNTIITGIYDKLYINKKSDLKRFITAHN